MCRRLLWLPVGSRRITLGASIALFAYYVATMSRSLSMYDSPELALVAEQLGLGHPFGQPIHTTLGALAARLPGVDPLVALNGLSALFGAITVIPVTSLAEALLRPEPDGPPGDSRLVAPTIALLGVHPALWEPATRIEVYSIAVFFALWAAARFVHAILDRGRAWRPYVATGLALGLSAAANVVCAVGVAFAMTPRLIVAVVRKEVPKGTIAAIVMGGLLGLTTYGYVFVVAGRQDVFVWGAPTDVRAIVHYFTGADFTYKSAASWAEWWDHVVALLRFSFLGGVLAIWVAGFAGYSLFGRKRGLGGLFFAATLVFFIAFLARNGVFAPDVLDYAGYLASPTWIAAAGVGLFVAFLGARSSWSAAAALSALLILIFVASPGPYRRTRHADSFTEDIARDALLAAPTDAILITEHDHWIAPMLYLQERHALRTDVVLLPHGLAASGWYWNLLYRRHPGLSLIDLHGPGGRDGRIRRFLRANPGRPVQIERVALATRLGLPTCATDWLLDVRSRCRPIEGEPALARASAAALAELGDGSPGTDGLIALVTLHRAHDLFVQGWPRAAIAAALAGVPQSDGVEDVDLSVVPTRVEPADRAPPAYLPHVALGHPARNLHYASTVATSVGAVPLSRYLAGMAEALGPVEPKFATLPVSPDNL